MTATIVVQEITGTGPKVFTTITNRVRLFTADQATNQSTPQITYPVPIPAAGFSYSYWKHVCLDISSTFTSVGNIRHYSDSAIGWNFGSGGQLRRGARDSGDQGVAVDDLNGHSDGYQIAAGSQGVTGYTLEDGTNGHAFYKGQTTPTANVASDVAPNGCSIEGAANAITAAGKSKAIVFQVKVDTVANGAASGVQTAETMTWKYDVID